MNKNKLTYLSPETETLVVRFEGNLLTVSAQGNTIQNATYDAWDEEL